MRGICVLGLFIANESYKNGLMIMLQLIMPEAKVVKCCEVARPIVGEHDVLINMKRLGICGSDIQVYHGLHRYMTFPVVQGHEGSGIVIEVGDGVTSIAPGDKVTVQPQVFCGECQPCKTGNENVCQNLSVYGIHIDGMAQEYISMPESVVVKLPENMDYDTGAFVEPTAVAAGTLRRCGNVKQKNVAIMGAGAIGNLIAQMVQVYGGNCLLTDINERRLELAQECGIKDVQLTAEITLAAAIDKSFGSAGADINIDCAGTPFTFNTAVSSARPASKIVIVANFKQPVTLELPLIQRQSIDIIGVMMYVRQDYLQAIELLAANKINIDKLISTRFHYTKLAEAYHYIDSYPEKVMKVVLDFD